MLHRTGRALALLILLGGVAPLVAAAQSAPDATGTALVREMEVVSANLLAAARDMPEDRYSWKPSDDVRSFGEIIDHVADAHFGYCAAISGSERHEAARSEATTKSEIVDRFEASHEYCLDAYRRVSGSSLGETISVFGAEESRSYIMIHNVAHSNLHYGNVVTYMRANGLVPPSSQTSG